ncbi:MAG: hypothetical protein U0487_03385 [Patescibacteria group bacterium]
MIFIGLSGYWIFEIVQNLQEVGNGPLLPTTSTVTIIPRPTNDDAHPLESQEQQKGYQIVKSVPFTNNGKTVELVHQCGHELFVAKNPLTQERVTFCRGMNRLVLKRADGQYRVLDTVDAKVDTDIPLLTYAKQTIAQGAQVIMIFERDACPVNPSKCGETGLRAMTHSLDLGSESYKRLSSYPSRSKPVWNTDGTKAVFITQTCGATRCDAAPLMGYDLVNDKLTRLTQEEGANEDYAKDVTGKKLGYWRSATWTSLAAWSAVYVSDAGVAKTFTGTLQ